jgi:hypothetical protein
MGREVVNLPRCKDVDSSKRVAIGRHRRLNIRDLPWILTVVRTAIFAFFQLLRGQEIVAAQAVFTQLAQQGCFRSVMFDSFTTDIA